MMNALLKNTLQKLVLPAVCLSVLALSAPASAAHEPAPFKKATDMELCLQAWSWAPEQCYARTKEYVQAHPKEELAVAKLVRRNFKSESALIFFEGPLARHESGVCKDDDLSEAVLAGLALPADYPEAGKARAIFSTQCQADLEARVIKEVSAEKGHSYLKDNACPILSKSGKAPASCQANK